MASIDDVAATIRAGLDADQEAAQWASAGPWWVESGEPLRWGDQRDSEVVCPKGTVAVLAYDRNGALNADHIARHSPTRVLAEVASKRALLDEALGWEHGHAFSGEGCPVAPCLCGRDDRILAVLTLLARPYQEKT